MNVGMKRKNLDAARNYFYLMSLDRDNFTVHDLLHENELKGSRVLGTGMFFT